MSAPTAARGTKLLARSATAVAAVLALAGSFGCTSSTAGPDEDTRSHRSFCSAVERYAEAKRDHDTAAMATALELDDSRIPDEVAESLDAYRDTLESAPPNQQPEEDNIENDGAMQDFEDQADRICGNGTATGSGSTTTTDGDTTGSTEAETSGSSTTSTMPGVRPTTTQPDNANREGSDDDGSTGYTDGGSGTEDDSNDGVGG